MSTDLQNRLQNFEASPSDHVWSKIEAALDQKSEPALEKLYAYEEEPAPIIWNKIEKVLDAAPTNKAKVVGLNYTKTYKFAIAAAIFILAIAGITYLFSNNNASSEIAVNQPKNPISTKPDSNIPATNKKVNNLVTTTEKASAEKQDAINATVLAGSSKVIMNRYTTMENEKGKVVRLSKKVIPVFDCADNEKAKENSHCKEDIATLQHKMATSSIASSADFAGLIDMLKDLKENKN